jgi:hypothetical protein
VGVGNLSRPSGVACSAFDEIVVADTGDFCVVFSASGEMLRAMGGDMGGDGFSGVAICGGTILLQAFNCSDDDDKCVVFT